MNKIIKISCVATTYNNEDEIIPFLDNILNQTVIPEEIVISDGGSKDRTVDLIKQYIEETSVKIIVRHGRRLNIAEGFNDAIKNVLNDVVFIAGVGNKYPVDFLEKLYVSFIEKNADVMCPYICGQDNTKFACAYNKAILKNNKGTNGIYAPNHGCIAKKKIFDELGYFYEGFYYAGEDAEFFGLARKKGYKVLSNDNVKVFWDTPHSWSQFFKQLNVYTIAEEQQLTAYELLKENNRSLFKLVSLLFSMVCLFVPYMRVIGLLLILAFFLRIIRFISIYGVEGTKVVLARRYLRIWFYIKNRKFLADNYKVKR